MEKKVDDPAFVLSQDSASQLSNRLAFFRVAFGLAEGRQGDLSIGEAKLICEKFINKDKIRLLWLDRLAESNSMPVGSLVLKVLLLLVLSADKCLPRGGEIRAQLSDVEGGDGMAIKATGKGAFFSGESLEALELDCSLDKIGPNNVHIYFVQQLTKTIGAQIMIDCEGETDSVQFAVSFAKR
jgi:histidine phosphotransferase ChpT